jgi:ABC-type transport system involved in multi-copper enzyme maturation permease subunit
VGIVRGELFKVSRQRATWLMAAILVAIMIFPYFIVSTLRSQFLATQAQQAPLQFMYAMMGNNLLVLRVFAGPFLIIVTARLIGMEYSGGTIRVLLARGVGRLQLITAKLLTAGLIGLAVLLFGLALDAVLTPIAVHAITGSTDAFQALNANFWADTRLYIGTVAISMAVTILMAAAVTVIGRSLAIGLSVGISFFAADNIGLIFFLLANRLTNSDFWLNVTGLLLGPNLNAMAGAVLPARVGLAVRAGLQPPLVPVDGGHTLLVTAVWALAFLAAIYVLTWRRDVTE